MMNPDDYIPKEFHGEEHGRSLGRLYSEESAKSNVYNRYLEVAYLVTKLSESVDAINKRTEKLLDDKVQLEEDLIQITEDKSKVETELSELGFAILQYKDDNEVTRAEQKGVVETVSSFARSVADINLAEITVPSIQLQANKLELESDGKPNPNAKMVIDYTTFDRFRQLEREMQKFFSNVETEYKSTSAENIDLNDIVRKFVLSVDSVLPKESEEKSISHEAEREVERIVRNVVTTSQTDVDDNSVGQQTDVGGENSAGQQTDVGVSSVGHPNVGETSLGQAGLSESSTNQTDVGQTGVSENSALTPTVGIESSALTATSAQGKSSAVTSTVGIESSGLMATSAQGERSALTSIQHFKTVDHNDIVTQI